MTTDSHSKLGIGLSQLPGTKHADIVRLAREVEDAGFGGVFLTEALNDTLLGCFAIARATRRIRISSWIANIYLRAPTLCAAAARTVQEESEGRFALGLGVSHRPALTALGIEMGNARQHLRDYAGVMRGQVPVHFGALTKRTAKLAGEIADGLMLYLASPERMRSAIALAHDEARRNGREARNVAVTMGLPAFVDDDLGRAFKAAQSGLVFFASLPFFNRILAREGFAREAKAITEASARHNWAEAAAAITESLADWLALVGPPRRCLERLSEYRDDGAVTPVIVPNPVNSDYVSAVRRCLKVFAGAA